MSSLPPWLTEQQAGHIRLMLEQMGYISVALERRGQQLIVSAQKHRRPWRLEAQRPPKGGVADAMKEIIATFKGWARRDNLGDEAFNA